MDPKLIYALHALKTQEQKTRQKAFDLSAIAFDKQCQFILDPARFKVACNSRRSGKTVGDVLILLDAAKDDKPGDCLYITLNRLSAKRIIWRELLKYNREYGLGGEANTSELTLTMPNGNVIYCSGAKDASEIEKFRGLRLKVVIIDEAQAFGEYLRELIEDVIMPALWDLQGSCIMSGTPNAACIGPFYDACHNIPPFKGWKNFHWTILDNPFIEKLSGKLPQQILAEELERKGLTEDDPTYLREALGLWIRDEKGLVYKYLESRNAYNDRPKGHEWFYGIGVDLGWDDADAISVIAWTEDLPEIYEVYTWKGSKQTISDLAKRVHKLEERYTFTSRVMDAGGLGKKIVEELKQRHQLYFEAAEKKRKLEYIELLNDDLRRAICKIHAESPLAEEMKLLQWDTTHIKPKEDANFDNHACDAYLYIWREAKHYTHEPAKEEAKEGSEEWQRNQWKEIAREDQQKGSQEWWEKL